MLGAAGARGQAAGNPRRVAVLLAGSAAGFRTRYEAFRGELARLGHVEGRDISLEVRFAEDKTEALHTLAAELVALRPAVIATASSAGVIAARKATSTIPIIFATGTRPVEQGFVESLRRPGGNITGVLSYEGLVGKCVELARDALPKAKRLALLVHTSDPAHGVSLEQFNAAVSALGFEPVIARFAGVAELDRAFGELVARKADALVLAVLTLSTSRAPELADRSLKAKLPLISPYIEAASAGALLGYGVPREESYRRAAALVDKILRGAKPGELPVERPDRFELAVNLKTAKAVGVTFSEAFLLRASRVIE